jgi:hypothetical protein
MRFSEGCSGPSRRSAKEGYWRLYFSSTLKRYAEFKEEDVLHSVKVPRALPPFLGMEATRVWIRQDAEVEYTRHESRRVPANSLAARRPTPGGEGQEGFLAAFFPVPTDRPDDAVLLGAPIIFPTNILLVPPEIPDIFDVRPLP